MLRLVRKSIYEGDKAVVAEDLNKKKEAKYRDCYESLVFLTRRCTVEH